MSHTNNNLCKNISQSLPFHRTREEPYLQFLTTALSFLSNYYEIENQRIWNRKYIFLQNTSYTHIWRYGVQINKLKIVTCSLSFDYYKIENQRREDININNSAQIFHTGSFEVYDLNPTIKYFFLSFD